MLKSMGVEYVLCGHSERRSVFQDSDVVINRKASHNIQPQIGQMAVFEK